MTSTIVLVDAFNEMLQGMKIDPGIYTEVPAHCPAWQFSNFLIFLEDTTPSINAREGIKARNDHVTRKIQNNLMFYVCTVINERKT